MARFERTGRFLRQALRLTLRVVITLVVIGGAGAAVFYGQSFLEARAAAVPEPKAAPLTIVSVRELELRNGYRQTRAFVGQIEPQRTVAVSFELAGKLIDIAVDEGDEVETGQRIASQDVDLLTAEQSQLQSSREALEAQLDFALQRLERAESLLESGFASQERLDQAVSSRDELAARIRETDARLETIAIRLEKSTIEAPFDGRVTRRFLDGGEALSPGQTVLEIVETEAPLVRVGVPLSLAPESLRDAVLVLNGEEFEAEFLTLRPDIDPTTRTRTALYRPTSPIPAPCGQTAEIRVETDVAAKGTWVPVASLKEGARGQWTLLVINQANVVQRATALVIYAETDRVFVQGSFPEGTRMIEEGPQRVVPGQRVSVVEG